MVKSQQHLSTAGFSFLSGVKSIFLDTLFPFYCLSCQKYGQIFCNDCLENIEILEDQLCPYCEKIISPQGKICRNCREKFLSSSSNEFLDFLISATHYKENCINQAVYAFKYNFIQDLDVPLGKILISSSLQNEINLPDIISPIPLHKRRLRWRGFNQSELLAKYLSLNLTPGLEIPLKKLILRQKFTSPQMKIKNYQERKANLQNVFTLNSNYDISGKYILLVDDIATTGATLFECAKVLKLAGAKKVGAIVIARQEIAKKD